METITGRMEKGEGTVGHILTDDTIARNIESITDDAGGFIRSITKLQTIVGLRTEYNFLSGQPKEYLAIQLVPRPDKFYLIEIVNDPRGLSENTLTSTESMNKVTPSQPTTYSQNKLNSSGGFDFFLGGQLVFNDEDLKSLLLFGGCAAAGGSK